MRIQPFGRNRTVTRRSSCSTEVRGPSVVGESRNCHLATLLHEIELLSFATTVMWTIDAHTAMGIVR